MSANNRNFNEYFPKALQAHAKTIAAVISLCFVIFLCVLIEKTERQNELEKKQIELNKAANDIHLAFEKFTHPLQGIVALLHLSKNNFTSHDFKYASEARDFYSNFEGALGFGVIKKIQNSELANYTNKVRKHNSNFTIKHLEAQPNDKLPNYSFIIEMVEPQNRNEKAIGLAISDDKTRRKAAEDAIISGKPTITKKIQLVQSGEKATGFLLYYPFYRQKQNWKSAEEREKNFVAFAYAPIVLSNVVNWVKTQNPNFLNFSIHELNEDHSKTALFELSNNNHTKTKDLLTKQINIFNSEWEISAPLVHSGFFYLHTKTYLALSFGLFLLALTIIAFNLNSLKSKNEIEILYHQLLEAQQIAKIGSWKFDLINNNQVWSKEHYRIFEIEEPQTQENLYKLYRSRIHPNDLPELDRLIQRAATLGEDFTYNHRVCLDNGLRIKHVKGIGKVTKDLSGKPIYVSGTCQDLTDFVSLQEQNNFILNAMGIGVWIFNPITKELTWDESMYKLYGLNQKDFSGHYQAWVSSLSDETRRNAVEELEQALSGQKEFDTIFEIITKSGERKQIGGKGIVIRNEKGDPILMYGINWDRTKEVKQEHNLKASLALNEAIKKSAKFSIITTNLEGLITGFNKEAERILGYSAEEMIGKLTPATFHDPIEVALTAKKLSKEHNEEVPVGFDTFVFKARRGSYDERQWSYIRKDGTRIPVSLNVTGLYDPQGQLYGFMGIAKDISQQIELENKLTLERSKSMHAAKLASLGEMSAGVAHEINNPLTVIVGNIRLLSKLKDDEEKFISKITTIEKAAERITKIVKGLRKFARASDNVMHKVESLNEIIAESLVLTEAKAKRLSTPITVNSKPDLYINCDQVEIEQVLVNLINNGIDAARDLPEKWVNIVAFSEDSEIVIQVIDSGNGITPEIEQKLFQPFFTTKVVGEGTGLGLSISKGILDEHKASIKINRTFKNTCFEIRFAKATPVTSGVKNVA